MNWVLVVLPALSVLATLPYLLSFFSFAREAATTCADVAVAAGSGAARDVLRLLEESAAPTATSLRSANAVFNRMVAYADGTTLRARRR